MVTHDEDEASKRIGLADLIDRLFESPGTDQSLNIDEDPMRDLNYHIKQICNRNRDGSYSTQANRERTLTMFANRLYELGYMIRGAQSLKPKHVTAVFNAWIKEGLSAGTLKNRAAEVRWLLSKIGKENIMPRENAALGIDDRVFSTNVSKSRELDEAALAKVRDPYTVTSLRLQAAFGLRREESIKIIPSWADRGDCLALRDSWTKGGHARSVPILNDAQRKALADAKALAGSGSLIPREKNYIQQRRTFEYQCARAGIQRVHGHRHLYAQQRYETLTGWKCPANGGPTSKQLTPEQRRLDAEVRSIVSQELGHVRIAITVTYLGR